MTPPTSTPHPQGIEEQEDRDLATLCVKCIPDITMEDLYSSQQVQRWIWRRHESAQKSAFKNTRSLQPSHKIMYLIILMGVKPT